MNMTGTGVRVLDEVKICFISAVNDVVKYNVSLETWKKLSIPNGMKVESLVIDGATSMTEAYQKGMEHYNDEDKAKKYAEYCANGDEIADFNDSFEECARSNEPWPCLSASGGDLFSEGEKYDADFLISCYYEWGLDGAYGDDEIRLDSKCGSYSFIPAAVAEETD